MPCAEALMAYLTPGEPAFAPALLQHQPNDALISITSLATCQQKGGVSGRDPVLADGCDCLAKAACELLP